MKQAIGMFDSGFGGLTVMQEVMRLLPHEDIIYFGDTARLPYGNKSQSTIIRYAIENTTFLLQQSIKMLIIPCNTATAFAIDTLKQQFELPILGVIEPGVEKAISTTRNGHIAVLGTKGTISSGAYQAEILRRLPSATIHAIPCPLFVPLVEENLIHHNATKIMVQEYLTPLLNTKVDTVLLGCTHYPLIQHLIEAFVGKGIAVINSASTCASKAVALLSKADSLNTKGRHQFYVSDDPETFRKLGSQFLGIALAEEQVKSSNSMQEIDSATTQRPLAFSLS